MLLLANCYYFVLLIVETNASSKSLVWAMLIMFSKIRQIMVIVYFGHSEFDDNNDD